MNCYRHQGLLLVHADNGYAGHWFASREGVTQGDSPDIILYGISILPLILKLKVAVSTCVQPWYEDNAAAGGSSIISTNFLI